MAVLDSWAYGLPVITTPVGGIPDIAIDGENIILFNADEAQSLAEKLKQLIINRTLQIKLSNAALNFANKQFSLRQITFEMNVLYDKLF